MCQYTGLGSESVQDVHIQAYNVVIRSNLFSRTRCLKGNTKML